MYVMWNQKGRNYLEEEADQRVEGILEEKSAGEEY